jgi:hypothetical protein
VGSGTAGRRASGPQTREWVPKSPLDPALVGQYPVWPQSGMLFFPRGFMTNPLPFGWRPVVLLAMLATAGCDTLPHKTKSLLLPPQMSSNSVVLDMFFVRVPFGDANVNGKLWEEIDEQHFAPELRERLARNGFRIGLVSGQMPVELSKLLELSDKPPPNGDLEETSVENLDVQPTVTRRHSQLPAGQPTEIIASGVYSELPVLMSDSGQLCGQTYTQARGIFTLKSFPQSDGRVRLELTPELYHDQPRQRFVAGQGVLRLEAGQPKRTFDNLTISTDVSPGAMLVLTSLANRPGSLGHHFFTENSSRLEQKLLVIRLGQTQHNGLFGTPETRQQGE